MFFPMIAISTFAQVTNPATKNDKSNNLPIAEKIQEPKLRLQELLEIFCPAVQTPENEKPPNT